MSTVNETVATALVNAGLNAWAVELPSDPTYPALVFDIETRQEEQWCHDGGYDQHTVTVVLLSRSLAEIDSLKPTVRALFEAMAGFMFEDAGGDVDYEDDPNVFGYFMVFLLRARRA